MLPEAFKPEPPHRYETLDRIRMLVEALAFGWVIPGRQRQYTE
jgi:hypothetical protein